MKIAMYWKWTWKEDSSPQALSFYPQAAALRISCARFAGKAALSDEPEITSDQISAVLPF